MREIQRLRLEQEAHAKSTADAQYNPTLLAELRLLRQRKDELENRMQALQESRKELMLQLESLMKLLKVGYHGNSSQQWCDVLVLFPLLYQSQSMNMI